MKRIPKVEKCLNCGHEIYLYMQEYRHKDNSFLCREPNCQCMDAIGKHIPVLFVDRFNLKSVQHPFNGKKFKGNKRLVIH